MFYKNPFSKFIFSAFYRQVETTLNMGTQITVVEFLQKIQKHVMESRIDNFVDLAQPDVVMVNIVGRGITQFLKG